MKSLNNITSVKKLCQIAVFILLAAVIISCKKVSSVQLAQQQQIIGKWSIKNAIGSYTVLGSNRKDTTKYTASDYFNFKADGSLTIVETNTTYKGNWKINNNKLYITNTGYIDYASGFDLPVLTATDLQLYYTETNPTNTLEQKLNLYR
ncbi:hypothetical protein [Mucilaginibacter ginkgonis]|uniref:Lipocalin-like domain-containing protein n=1 Tax=Mucilaginibacter ginkgonis TaxID=2682091 RepID=A0A6I4HXG3_9SPHI|nr:hypothetical protein [Mucilaginibacter ginkgonis]QQL49354.1 hypothetical protein GO620_014430 [Mucilaginibacter ginkgonis]